MFEAQIFPYISQLSRSERPYPGRRAVSPNMAEAACLAPILAENDEREGCRN